MKSGGSVLKNGGKCPPNRGEVSPKQGGSVLTKYAATPCNYRTTGILYPLQLLSYIVTKSMQAGALNAPPLWDMMKPAEYKMLNVKVY